jgi:hypothetical protein
LRGSSDLGEVLGSLEYLGKSSTISLALYDPKCETVRMTIGFLHSFNNNFCAGAELLSELMRNQVQYNLALAARYVFSPLRPLMRVFAFVYSVSQKRNMRLHNEFFNRVESGTGSFLHVRERESAPLLATECSYNALVFK